MTTELLGTDRAGGRGPHDFRAVRLSRGRWECVAWEGEACEERQVARSLRGAEGILRSWGAARVYRCRPVAGRRNSGHGGGPGD